MTVEFNVDFLLLGGFGLDGFLSLAGEEIVNGFPDESFALEGLGVDGPSLFFTQTITQSGLSSFSEELVERFLNLLGFGLGSWLSGGSIGGWGLLLWGRGTGGGFLGLSVLLAFNFGSQFGSTLISTPT